MKILNRREPVILFVGDLIAFSAALWLALTLRYGSVPSQDLLTAHWAPFSILFLLWIFVFFVAGLYEKHTLVFKNKLPSLILSTQVINSLLAVVFFYLIPSFGITPKTVLALQLVISFLLIVFWRLSIVPRFGFRYRENAILVGAGPETRELKEEVNGNERYNLKFVSSIDLDRLDSATFKKDVLEKVYQEGVTSIVVDLKHEKADTVLPMLYNLIFSNVRFLDMHKVYEEVFDRIPLSLIGDSWFLENISSSPHTMYDTLKRAMDIILAVILGLFSLILFPFVAIAIKLDDGGPIFTAQERIGQGNRRFLVYKFRTLERIEEGVWHKESKNNPTRVGRILRITSIDELPQILNILRGQLSFIGPRSDLASLEPRLRESLPYYSVRYLVRPGISGWAQVNQHYAPGHINPQTIDENRVRLAYDLYYLKNRSFVLDLIIALKTVKTLLSRTGK